MYSTIKSAIITKLQGLSGLKNVYGYEKGEMEYPAVMVTLKTMVCDFLDTRTDERTYSFDVKIYQEMNVDAAGAETAESTIDSLVDSVLALFEDDWTLGGNCQRVNIKGITGYAEAGLNLRVLQFTIDCYTVYSLT